MSQDILYRRGELNGQPFQQPVLPLELRDVVYTALYDDLGHQDRDRTTSLVKQRFYWPEVDAYVKERVQKCDRCIKRSMSPKHGRAGKHYIYRSHGNPLSRLPVPRAIESRRRTYLGHYGPLHKIHTGHSNYQPDPKDDSSGVIWQLNGITDFRLGCTVSNFEAKLIEEFCKIAGTENSRTTSYHFMGNGQW